MPSRPRLPEPETGPGVDADIRGRRAAKEVVDAWRPLAVLTERERTVGGGVVSTATVFLTGSECPFTCVFCDLWRSTLDEPTPPGAIPAQLELAIAKLERDAAEAPVRIKLYNASNFFDVRAVPSVDHAAIAALVSPFERVVVECHPRLVGDSCVEFADLLDGKLEVAMGLETVHPRALPRLNKRMSRHDYDRAARFLGEHGIVHRGFVLVGAPFVPADRMIDWAVITTAYALDRGAETVTLIPVRGAELAGLERDGWFERPSLDDVETALDRALGLPGPGVVQVDLWDLEQVSRCRACYPARRERLARVNLSGVSGALPPCRICGDNAR